ncbi:hypothetical protein PNOK_0347400 [Pyrrhoderma noxium]|uniref:Uncharacterized protein n=1 Tax=Pyrrhoderma noxium TaxID=2282107 RepID=A0A286UML1_9AGAM|nr:hypothetical protein PNOK_0347400 [Pyrrhoderma noxium]
MDVDDKLHVNKHLKTERSPLQQMIPSHTQNSYSFSRNLKFDGVPTKSPFSKLSATHVRNPSKVFVPKDQNVVDKLLRSPRGQEMAYSIPFSRYSSGYGTPAQDKNRQIGSSDSPNQHLRKEPNFQAPQLFLIPKSCSGSYDATYSSQYDPLADDSAIFHQHTIEHTAQAQESMVIEQSYRSPSNFVDPKSDPADDLSALMFKGATDLRNAKSALEEQSKLVNKLEENLRVVTSEKKDLEKKLITVKERTTKSLDRLSKNLVIVNNALESLRSQTQNYKAATEETKISLSSLDNWKNTAKDALNQIKTMIGEDGSFTPTFSWKNVLNEIRSDMASKQQVIDLFRDRIEYTQGELMDSRNRISELECIQTQSNSDLKASAEKLLNAEESLNKISELTRLQQQQNMDILSKNLDLESKLSLSIEKISSLEDRLAHSEAEHEELIHLRNDLEVSRSLLNDRDEQIQCLQISRERLLSVEASVTAQEQYVKKLEESLSKNTENVEIANKKFLSAEAQVKVKLEVVSHLEKSLADSRSQLQAELELHSQTCAERDSLRRERDTLLEDKSNLSNEIEAHRARSSLSEAKNDLLQERLEEQASMLLLERKTREDTHKYFESLETTSMKKLESIKHLADSRIMELKNVLAPLENKLEEQRTATMKSIEEYSTASLSANVSNTEYMRKLESSITQKLDESSLLQKSLTGFAEENKALYKQIQVFQEEVRDLHEVLSVSQTSSKAQLDEVTLLRHQVENYRRNEDLMTQRAKNIVSRYTEGNLSYEEKQLIEAVHKASQVAHEQQLIAKSNEIRQRDNVIKSLSNSKSELETRLTRILNSQIKLKAGPDGTRSLIDPKSWSFSQVGTATKDQSENSAYDCPTTTLDIESGPDDNDIVDQTNITGENTPTASTFSKLENQKDVFDGNPPMIETPSRKRKGGLIHPSIEGSMGSPPRRLRITRSMQAPNDKSHIKGVPNKISEVAPKIKARKRR